EIKTVLSLKERLEQRVIGQTQALEAICQRIRTARANLTDPRRPTGVFLLVGPSGVGKTETSLALAEALYGGERNLVSLNMSENQEASIKKRIQYLLSQGRRQAMSVMEKGECSPKRCAVSLIP